MIVSAVAFPLLLAFWAFVGWRVHLEKGIVDPATPLQQLRHAIRRMTWLLGEALTPAIRLAATRIRAWGDAWSKAMADAMTDEERAQMFSIRKGGSSE